MELVLWGQAKPCIFTELPGRINYVLILRFSINVIGCRPFRATYGSQGIKAPVLYQLRIEAAFPSVVYLMQKLLFCLLFKPIFMAKSERYMRAGRQICQMPMSVDMAKQLSDFKI